VLDPSELDAEVVSIEQRKKEKRLSKRSGMEAPRIVAELVEPSREASEPFLDLTLEGGDGGRYQASERRCGQTDERLEQPRSPMTPRRRACCSARASVAYAVAGA
jgi:hypothetical protein